MTDTPFESAAPAEPVVAPVPDAAPPPTAAGAGGAAAPPDWIAGLDDAGRQLATTKGWKTPADALASYSQLEKTLGAEKLALPAKRADGARDLAAWDGWTALGRPERPDDYRFPAPEGAEPAPLDQALQQALRPALHQAGLAQWQLDKLAEAYTGFTAELEATAEQAAASDRRALEQEWGQAFDANLALANRAYRLAFGEDLDAVRQLQLAGGKYLLDDARVARAFARLGAAMAEDGELGDGAPAPGQPTTPSAALAEIERIRGEAWENPKHAYNDASHPEHGALHERMLALYRIANARGASR